MDISRTEIWDEISETNWRQCSIAERSLLLPNFILNLLLSFCGERKRAMLEPDQFYIITQKDTVAAFVACCWAKFETGQTFELTTPGDPRSVAQQ